MKKLNLLKKLKFEKAQFTNNGAIQLYIAREGSGSGGKLPDPDPAKRSGSATLFKVEVGQKCKFFKRDSTYSQS